MITCKQALQQVANEKPHSGYIVFYVASDERDVVLQVAQVSNLRNKEMFQRVVTTIDHLEKRHHLSIHWKVWKDKVKPQQKVPKMLRIAAKEHAVSVAPLTAKEMARWPKLVKPLVKVATTSQRFICPENTPLATFQTNLQAKWNSLRQQNERASICTIIAGTTYVACTSIGQMKEWLQQNTLSPTLCLTVPLRVGFSRNKKEAIAQLNEWTNEKVAYSEETVKVKPLTDALFLKRTKPFHIKQTRRAQKEPFVLEAHVSEREVKRQLAASVATAPQAKLFLLSSGTDVIHLGQVHDLKEWLQTSSDGSFVTRAHIRVDWVNNKKEALSIANEQMNASPSPLGKWKVKPFTHSVSSRLFIEKKQEKSSPIAASTNEARTITVEENKWLNREEVRHNESPLEQSVTKGTPREQRNRARTIAETKTKGLVNVYVDGSYLPNVGISAYGFVAEDESGMEVQKDFGMTVEERLRELGSLGAELHACLRGIEWAIANNYQTVRIYYDFIGIIQKLQEEQSKTKHERMYFGLYEMYSEHIRILFRKVSPSGKEGRAHLRAHDLSRLPSTLYMN